MRVVSGSVHDDMGKMPLDELLVELPFVLDWDVQSTEELIVTRPIHFCVDR